MGTYEIEEAVQLGSGNWLLALLHELEVAGLPLNARPNAYVNALLVKSGPGYLIGFTVYNSNAGAQFVQVHDSATLPAEGAVPELIVRPGATSDKGVYFGIPGRAFQRGIYLVNSSTGPTKTIGAADCWFDAQYI